SWDCNLYAVTTEGRLVWKFPASLSYQAPLGVRAPAATKSVQMTWAPATPQEKKEYKKDEVDIADYGEFSGKYIDTSKTDYLGRKKKGYM
ncbi:MAG: hypothetical protein ACE5FW_02230, partial [Candidatus Aenigmatarchaeota archaeon]